MKSNSSCRSAKGGPARAKVGKEKDIELGDLLETDNVFPEEVLMREALCRDLQYLLADLTERERDVILMHFGLGRMALS